MGNNLSTTSNSALVFLDQQATRAGETVSGNVCVNVYDTTAQFSGLAIQVEGVEQTRFSTDRNNVDYSVSDYHRDCWGRNELFQATIPLNLMEQNLNARRGQYQFPFTFQLPVHTPPSFSYRYGDLMAKVEYKVSVVLHQNASATNWTGRSVASVPLTVLSPQPPRSPRSGLERYAQQPVSDCCSCCLSQSACCVRGTVGTHVGADSEYIATGGSLGTYSLVWNGTSIPLHATLRLTRKMRVLDRYGNYRDEEEHLWTHREGPLPATSGSQMHRMSSRAFVPGSGSEALDTPSITTELIQCKYEVQSVVRPYSGCCGTRVIAALPITVVATPFQEPDFSEPPKPPDWNPQVFDSQALGFPAIAPATAPPPVGGQLPGGVHEPLLPPVSENMSYRITDHALV